MIKDYLRINFTSNTFAKNKRKHTPFSIMKKHSIKILLTCLVVLFNLNSFAQNAIIQGIVSNIGQTPLENISISVNGVPTTTTNTWGVFKVTKLKAGIYTLKITGVGYLTQEKTISIRTAETINEDFSLGYNQEQLSEVVVEGEKANKFSRSESEYVSKMTLKDIENPQVYNTITQELLKEQVITNFDDALKNAPGIDKLWESTGRGSDGAGYFSLRGFAVQPTMVNGLPGLTNGSPDPANIDRIDVIKGPSGTLYGSSLISYGGLINITTKRPYDTFGGNISYTSGTYGLNRITMDINTPLNKEKKINLRVNGAYHYENSFQDAGFKKSIFVAPSLSYTVNDKLSFLINTEFYNGRSTNQTMLFLDRGAKLRVTNLDQLGYDAKRSYTSNDLYMDTPTFNLQGQMIYKISSQWTSQTVISRASTKSDGYYSYLYEGTQYTPVTEGIVLSRYISKQNSETYGLDLQQNFIGDFKIGNIRNRVVAGIDYWNRNTVNNNSGYVENGKIYIGNNLQQFNDYLGNTDPATYTDDTGILSQAGTDALLANSPIAPSKTKQEVYSAYVSDVVNILPELSAMASLRVDRFINEGDLSTKADNYNQTALSPKFGLVYQPILDKVSLFANYMNGFSNVAPVTTPGGKIYTFDPERANQMEFGTKLNLLNNHLTATFSYYNVEVSNTVLQLSPEDYLQDGKQKNKGFEASVSANPIEGLNLIAGFSYNDSKLTDAEPGNDFANRRPESAGPRSLANFWASYRFGAQTKLNGFGLGFGGNYASENKIFNRNTAGTFTLPEYTVLNASVFYAIDAFQITLKLDNMTNKEYYKGWSTISPQRPRIFAANLTYNF